MMPPTTVSSAVVKEEDWAPILSAVGSISPFRARWFPPSSAGSLAQIEFQNGGEAKKGDVLVKLDASAEEAQLHSAEADLELARANLERDAGSGDAQSGFESGAGCGGIKVQTESKASVDNMRSMITKKTVRAPFDGQLGIRQVNVGQIDRRRSASRAVDGAGSGLCRFCVAAAGAGETCRPDLEVRVHTDALPGQEFKGKADRDQFDGRFGHAQCHVAGDSGKSRSHFETGHVCQGRSRVAGKTQDAGRFPARRFPMRHMAIRFS